MDQNANIAVRDPDDDRWRYINPDGSPDAGLLGRLTEAIVEAIDPERIILFGSGARADMHVHSDIDLLVIHEHVGPNRSQQAATLREALPLDRRAVDIILATPAEVAEADVDEPYHVVGVALAEGRIIYDRVTARRRRSPAAR